MGKPQSVPRPIKKSEYTLAFATSGAKKGWSDLVATMRGPMAEVWDFLTRNPTTRTPTNYPLKGELAYVTRDGQQYERWQHKPTAKGTARIWFYMDNANRVVRLEQVHTHHPNETK